MKFNFEIQGQNPVISIAETGPILTSDLTLMILFLRNGRFLSEFQNFLMSRLSADELSSIVHNAGTLDAEISNMIAEAELEALMQPIINKSIIVQELPE